MKDSIAQVFDKTKDALLVEKYFGEEINPGFIAEITIRDHKDEILAEARRRETAATMSE